MNHITIIAEAGVNHNGDLNLAKEMIKVAASSGADYIKFQTFITEKLVSQTAELADYQKENLKSLINESNQYEILKKYELDYQTHLELIQTCNENNIRFLSTAFDMESIDLLNKLKIPFFKIPSGEITNLPYLEKISATHKPIVLSTGMSNITEIKSALDVFLDVGYPKNKISVLHCNTQYPTPMEDVNLRAMKIISETFDISVGYSDHTLGIEIPIAAVAMGASIIEKHFTLDRNFRGPDHKASIEPPELKQMIEAIRNIEKAMGSGEKIPSKSEIQNIVVARKSIHIINHKNPGDILYWNDIIMLRPGDGISPMEYKKALGRKVLNELFPGHKLQWRDLQN